MSERGLRHGHLAHAAPSGPSLLQERGLANGKRCRSDHSSIALSGMATENTQNGRASARARARGRTPAEAPQMEPLPKGSADLDIALSERGAVSDGDSAPATVCSVPTPLWAGGKRSTRGGGVGAWGGGWTATMPAPQAAELRRPAAAPSSSRNLCCRETVVQQPSAQRTPELDRADKYERRMPGALVAVAC